MADDADAAAAARAQAEARRQRILAKANKRMGKVSGEVGQDEDDKQQSASNAARIRAARQRRYGKKSTAAPKQATADDTSSPPTTTSETQEESKPEVTDAAPAESAVKDSPPKEATEDVANVVESPAAEKDVTDESTQNEEEPKKKYVGVAKMRRRMIAKKKAEEEAGYTKEEEKKGSIPSKPITDVDLPPQKTKAPVATFPVYMHIVTILLLFLAGMDVGLQQYHEDVKIHDQLSFKEHGIPLLNGNLKEESISNSIKMDSSSILNEKEDEVFEDEFQNIDDDLEPVPNIDPLFRVDLDELTKGPGIVNQLARGAIAIHRLFLQLIYYIPKNIITSLIGIPQALMETPPALCLIALVLRQIVGKRVLKAGIPTPEEDDKDSKDAVSMVKQFLSNSLSTMFPTVVGAYDALSHLRSDMYVIMCGVFFGLAWTHMSVKVPELGVGNDEL